MDLILLIVIPPEMTVDVAMMLDDIDHFETPPRVAKEDQVAFEGEATEIGAKLKPGAADRPFDRRELVALGTKLLDEAFATFTLPLASTT